MSVQARELDPSAFGLSGQRHRLAEQARSLVGPAAKLAREHRLGLREARADHQLGRGEDLAGCRGSPPFFRSRST